MCMQKKLNHHHHCNHNRHHHHDRHTCMPGHLGTRGFLSATASVGCSREASEYLGEYQKVVRYLSHLREGVQKKVRKSMVFYRTPLGLQPPPHTLVWYFSGEKNVTLFFLSLIRQQMGERNFTLSLEQKHYSFVL